MPDMQQACVEVDIGLGESEKLSRSQAGKIQKTQGSAQDRVPNRRCPALRQLFASLQEDLTLGSAEHPWHKSLAHNPQRAAIRYDRTGVFETQEATDFSDERQAMRAGRLRFSTPSRYVIVHNGQRDNGSSGDRRVLR
jgi:hypothetical protein